ncbi:MAG: tetratricopeptide repeat protein [Saprospiraceae bacterium]
MIRIFAFCIVYSIIGVLTAQNTRGAAPEGGKPVTTQGNSWAVIVGISDYQNPNIPDLSYSDKDADAFSKFLKSPAGGSLPEDHVVCLLNEKATAAQFAAALDWIMDKAKEGDQAIIFFAGHGDVERQTVTQPGFLLCWDSPSRVYMGGGTFGLFYLQEIISTISLQSKAKVIIITDACRSGKLAGSEIGGRQATALNLSKQFANEVKLMSCQPDELSLEGSNWGGGRGLFSFYLIKGLTGLADQNKDGNVTLFEIEKYLDEKVPAAAEPRSQIPMVTGTKTIVITKINKDALANLIKSEELENNNSNLLVSQKTKNNQVIKPALDPKLAEKLELFNKSIENKQLMYPAENSAWSLYNQLKSEQGLVNEINSMKSKLAAVFQDEAQQAINDYLNADPKELSNRWGFNDKYDRFPIYLNKAAELLTDSHYLYKTIKAREHYFTGLNIRLTGERKKDSSLFYKALIEQNLTLKLDSNAAYAYNEIGLLYRRLKNYTAAIDQFNKALLITPKWVFPLTNLAGCYYNLGNTDKAIEYGSKSIELDPSSALAQLNLARSYELASNWIKAREHYQKTIDLDPSLKEVRINICFMYYLEKDYIEAEKVIKEYKQLYPNDVINYLTPELCLMVIQNELDPAFELLNSYLSKGVKAFAVIEEESELKKFITDPRYLELKKKFTNQ